MINDSLAAFCAAIRDIEAGVLRTALARSAKLQ